MRPAISTALLGLVFAATAAVFDAEPLWVPAVVLVTLAAGSLAWVLPAARAMTVQRTLGGRRVMEGEPLRVEIVVRRGRVPAPMARLVDPLLSATPPLGSGRTARVRIDARFGRRGRRMLAPARVVVADPLGLVTREVLTDRGSRADEVLVLPRIEPIVDAGSGGGAPDRWLAVALRRPAGAETDVDGVQPLRDGTSASRIFWPSIARGGEPLERRMASGGDARPLVMLDPRDAASEEELDAAVRAAASLAHHLALAGGCGVLLPGDRRAVLLEPSLTGWAHVHARLALVGGTAGPSLAGVAHRRGPVILVSARRRHTMPAALGPAAAAERVLVVPGSLAERSAVFAVAGCRGYRLGARRAPRRRTEAA